MASPFLYVPLDIDTMSEYTNILATLLIILTRTMYISNYVRIRQEAAVTHNMPMFSMLSILSVLSM